MLLIAGDYEIRSNIALRNTVVCIESRVYAHHLIWQVTIHLMSVKKICDSSAIPRIFKHRRIDLPVQRVCALTL